jgi:hypothetical protein
MTRPRRAVLWCAAGAIGLLLLFPPYFGIDRGSEGRVHAYLGHHPVWKPPSSEHVFRALSPRGSSVPGPERLGAYQARLNVVNLSMKLLGVVVCAAGLQLIGRGRRGDASLR